MYCEMSDLSHQILLALTLSARKSGIKKNFDDVHWNVQKKVVCLKKYFEKQNYKYEILNDLYSGPNFVFWGTGLGRFSQCSW